MWLALTSKTLQALEELKTGSDRVVAVVAGAIIDSLLTDILKSELSPRKSGKVSEVQSNFFQPEGPVGSFAAKINLAYLLGFFSDEAYSDLHNFKNIRNLFAHYSEHNSFDSQRVKDRCANFKLIETWVGPATATRDLGDGKTEYIDSLMAYGDGSGIRLSLVKHEEVKVSPRGRFIATAQVLSANIEIFASSIPLHPDLKENVFKTKPIL
ncbi:MltR family transcriptional regulator [Bradyrhizobium sp. PMVTL-01]|uniref:MltR family transcriptional regulator n=1 Tax=Bradyrhizobium sp. PMVTL-01 TaxID=3434999 RepID=UPI003F6ECBFA